MLGDRKPVAMIRSFVEPAEPSVQNPEAFLWVGRLVDYKRPLEYVELARAMPEVRFRMLAFYPDPTNPRPLPEELRRAGRELSNLEFVDQLPRRELLGLIDRSFAIVSTSTFEGMPNVFLEAWARGVPVAALECDPDGRIVESDGGRVAGGSRERLVEIARSLSRDGELRSRLGRQGREYVLRVHDPSVVGGQWKDLLARVLD